MGCSWLACSPHTHPHHQLLALLFPLEGHSGTLRTLGSPTHLTSLLHWSSGCFLGEEGWFVIGGGVEARAVVFFIPIKDCLAVTKALRRAPCCALYLSECIAGKGWSGTRQAGADGHVLRKGTQPLSEPGAMPAGARPCCTVRHRVLVLGPLLQRRSPDNTIHYL